MMGIWDLFGAGGIGTLLFTFTTLERIIPDQLLFTIKRFFQNLLNFFNRYIEITFEEFPSESYGRNKAYAAIETYLGTNFSHHAESLKANIPQGTRCVALSMDDYEEVFDVYKGVKVSWTRSKSFPRSNVISFNGAQDEERRYYVLSFRRKHRDIIIGSYLSHVLSEGKSIAKRNRQQRLYTNVSGRDDWEDDEKKMWRHVTFEHPATFNTLAMDPNKKKDIMDDLIEFTKSKEYYRQIGKPWKRGYLLYGPPGTGKSTMIAAMANFLNYDIYDLELTAVKDNTHLRKAIVVIEDIDCSNGITRKRRTDNITTDDEEDNLKEAVLAKKAKGDDDSDDEDNKSKVTLSGLLNFMDGLWSASGGERVFVFTTNYVEKLDPALIRRGRMDKHIEMSYCCFEAFKVLANNYLKLESHEKFDKIKGLLEETDISPADIAENLMPKSPEMSPDECLGNVITALHKAKEKAEKNRKAKNLDADKEYNKCAEKRRSKVLRRLNTRMIRRIFS
ncbi:hypothetical protein DH2020_005314 [Rehmannia glutinosa]|uniref:AAA+ ATPase domain-containing protein n=1 Tax=Rehmannia glutinosa TaxID=99300 RepID=A0ABR0XFR8_REHGL